MSKKANKKDNKMKKIEELLEALNSGFTLRIKHCPHNTIYISKDTGYFRSQLKDGSVRSENLSYKHLQNALQLELEQNKILIKN